ncbi:hypothetical protein LAZ40_03515 [Cereibacter sphaeroides]|uniref:LPD7 domain-containing protein n=1 Tax=Cereibacter sphaeroides TaxID=1063 RepID=UPI001F3272BD|nr:LPD7 domain-containing protein [Cereibacter sphaeroides]MCE6958124.1 hypothetical protein [Cereibacter sphaeroides]MCE6971639.1 hypothetical protein [Cereibacter sphaeroides]
MAEIPDRRPPAPAVTSCAEGVPGMAEPLDAPPREGPDRFATPASFADRFLITKVKDRQELYRGHDAGLPAIVDTGDRLVTRAADRATAIDMIDLAAHRGWQSLRVKGPEDFRREMWIEASARGLRTEGYRPTDRDSEEAWRRSEILAERTGTGFPGPRGVRGPIEGRSWAAGNDMPEAELSRALQAEIGRLRTEGYSKAQICEDSLEIEAGVRQRWAGAEAERLSYAGGLRGTILETGTAPYKDREGATAVPFVRLALDRGSEHRLWSVTLPAMLDKHDLRTGDRATFQSPGVEAVTYRTKNPETGEKITREGHRRRWEAHDIERAPNREAPLVEPGSTLTLKPHPGSTAVAEKPREQDTRSDRLEDRIKRYEPGDTTVKGAASALARMETEMRAAGVGEKDREIARDEASRQLAHGLRAGAQYEVRTLPNVTKEQVAKEQVARPTAADMIQERRRDPLHKDHER